ncbi:OmpA family protein [Armatimonas rosea]|uniref:Outer membrane protein OmpA-like peptidoglycan-associated protein n=1 Tax=Armatimonas rosea TaxID=685828 RepID=A0A7W9W5E9_ARMRO|nr:OmpA family protein [Armatimonas rosea]MBB6048482.1 outer membrane protein OmpA-like peptidoglycan-associated protein [Armatimonas rosea]
MNKTTGKWLSGLGLVALLISCPVCHRGPIEQHLTAQSRTALTKAGLPEWARNVSYSGFDATLFGPSAEATRAGSVVRQVLTTEVPWLADIKILGKKSGSSTPATPEAPTATAEPSAAPSESPTAAPTPSPAPAASPTPQASPLALAAGEATGLVQILSYEGTVYVRGVYPDDASRQSALQAARAAFGSRVKDETTLSGKGGSLGWPEQALKSLSALKPVRGLELSAGGDLVTLTGQVGSDEEKTKLGGLVKASLPATVTVENRLTLAGECVSVPTPAPTAALPETERKSAQEKLNTVVGGGEVLFATASSRLRAEAYPYLDRIAEALKSQTSATVVVGGHTDNQGDEGSNRQLSQKRADSVRSYLIARGVPTRHLFAQGFGSSQPIASNAAEEGRRRNRRIGFVVR